MAVMNIKQIIDRLNAEFSGDTRKLVSGTMTTASLWRICRM